MRIAALLLATCWTLTFGRSFVPFVPTTQRSRTLPLGIQSQQSHRSPYLSLHSTNSPLAWMTRLKHIRESKLQANADNNNNNNNNNNKINNEYHNDHHITKYVPVPQIPRGGAGREDGYYSNWQDHDNYDYYPPPRSSSSRSPYKSEGGKGNENDDIDVDHNDDSHDHYYYDRRDGRRKLYTTDRGYDSYSSGRPMDSSRKVIPPQEDVWSKIGERTGLLFGDNNHNNMKNGGVGVLGMLNQPRRSIGLPLLGIGTILTLLGASLLFNKMLMRLGNIALVMGVPLTIGPGRTAGYFFQPNKARATGCLMAGIFLVVIAGWPMLGLLLELFGVLNLFGNMFPVAFAVLKTLPVIGPMLRGDIPAAFGGAGAGAGIPVSNNSRKNPAGRRRDDSSSSSSRDYYYQRDSYYDDRNYYDDGNDNNRDDPNDYQKYY